MTYNEFKDKLFALAKQKGFDAQVELIESSEFSLRYANDDIDQYTDASKFSVAVKILKNGKIGRVRIEKYDEPEKIFEEAYENWKVTDSEDEEFFYDGSGEYLNMQLYDGTFDKTSVTKKIEFVKKMYESAKKDERIVMVPYAMYENVTIEKKLANTLGLDVSTKSDGGYAFAMAVSKDETTHSGFWVEVAKKFEDLDPEGIGKIARENAISLLNARSVKSGKYKVLFKNTAFEDLLGLLVSMISAENVQKNMSPLKGKVNEKIGSSILNIKDVPYYPGSISSRPFDDEGVPTTETPIFENGVLKSYLYDLKTAKKDGTRSTGNSVGGAIRPINLVVEKGELSFDELVKKMDDGLVIVGVDGMHSGANPISGNFSLGARGFRVKDGKIEHAVEQITVSGNFLKVLENVEAVGSDIKIFQGIVTPSVLISEIDVAGE